MADVDPLLDKHGALRDRWHCTDCDTHVHLHPDPDHPSHEWTREFLAEHEYVHQQQMEAEHRGDRGALRLALKYPSLHAAIIQVHGPITDLNEDHRAQILRAARIEEK